MSIKVAINGFGRIGRMTFRALIESGKKDIEVVAINDLADPKTSLHLLKYDTVHGKLNIDAKLDGNTLVAGNQKAKIFAIKDSKEYPWAKLGVDIVFECTGLFTSKEKAQMHIDAGAKRVLISAPAKDADLTVVYGVNHDKITKDMTIFSNASCTTNCLAPIVEVMHRHFGIKYGYMTTIHSYTGDQVTLDRDLKGNLYRSRAAAQNIIPTTTGAAKAIGLVIPELLGKLDGSSIRVPTPDVSIVDFKFITNKTGITVEEINETITKEANSERYKNILCINDEELVSSDFIHNPASSTVDLAGTTVIGDDFVRVLSWYDNEWGYSNRMLDVARVIAKTL